MYECRICGRLFEKIPDDAVPIPSHRFHHLYKIENAIHDLKQLGRPAVRTNKQEEYLPAK
jgi:hypothetical protein